MENSEVGKESYKASKNELNNLIQPLELLIILATLLMSVLFVLANTSINIEATSTLASNNSFGANQMCSTHNTISGYYNCELNIAQHAYIPQYKVLDVTTSIGILLLISAIIFFGFYYFSDNIKRKGESLLISVSLITILFGLLLLYIGNYLESTSLISYWITNLSLIALFSFCVFYIAILNKSLKISSELISITKSRKHIAKSIGIFFMALGLVAFYFAITRYNYYYHIAIQNVSNFSELFVGIGIFLVLAIAGAVFFDFGLILAFPKVARWLLEHIRNSE